MFMVSEISTGEMATFGICVNIKNKPLTVVKPGTQQKIYTFDDTISVCIEAWKK